MKIQAVLIDGLRIFLMLKITFDNITALVALNNFGKSNVLSGIDFGLAFIKASIDDKMEMMANSNLIPINQSMQGRNYKFEVEMVTEEAEQEYRVQYGYEFSWQCDEDEVPEIVSEYLRIKLDDKGQKYTQLINRTKDTALYKRSETGRCSSKLRWMLWN